MKPQPSIHQPSNTESLPTSQIIKEYYDELAKDYDQDRFDNTYGQYIHQQEERILDRVLEPLSQDQTLDLATGTGRFLHRAKTGVDISPEMIGVAQKKFPNADLHVASGTDLPFEDQQFSQVLSFHLFMHLDGETMDNILKEVHRITQPGGIFVFDVPSEKRRKLVGYQSDNWHGGYQLKISDLKKRVKGLWTVKEYHGIAFFPLHRIPKSMRPMMTRLDSTLGSSPLGEYSSHLVCVLQRDVSNISEKG